MVTKKEAEDAYRGSYHPPAEIPLGPDEHVLVPHNIVNIGTRSNPVVVAPLGTALEDMQRAMEELGRTASDEEFLAAWAALADSYTATPRDELIFRLNANLRGDDPGEPVNTGPSGWRAF